MPALMSGSVMRAMTSATGSPAGSAEVASRPSVHAAAPPAIPATTWRRENREAMTGRVYRREPRRPIIGQLRQLRLETSGMRFDDLGGRFKLNYHSFPSPAAPGVAESLVELSLTIV